MKIIKIDFSKLTTFSLAAIVSFSVACKSNSTATTTDSTTVTKDSSVKSDSSAQAASPDNVKPSQAMPAWAPDIAPQMQAVIEKLASYGDKPIPQLAATEARKNHTATDAVMDVMKQYKISMPPTNVDTTGKDIRKHSSSHLHSKIRQRPFSGYRILSRWRVCNS